MVFMAGGESGLDSNAGWLGCLELHLLPWKDLRDVLTYQAVGLPSAFHDVLTYQPVGSPSLFWLAES